MFSIVFNVAHHTNHMIDSKQLLEVVPHYIALLSLVFLSLIIIRVTIGSLGFWIELLIILVISFAYQPLVIRLGIAPSSWERN